MSNKNYRKGYRYEKRAVAHYENLGFHTVFRSAGSHGPADVIAVCDDFVLFAQVKSHKGGSPSYRAEMDEFAQWRVPPNDVKEFVVYDSVRRTKTIFPVPNPKTLHEGADGLEPEGESPIERSTFGGVVEGWREVCRFGTTRGRSAPHPAPVPVRSKERIPPGRVEELVLAVPK